MQGSLAFNVVSMAYRTIYHARSLIEQDGQPKLARRSCKASLRLRPRKHDLKWSKQVEQPKRLDPSAFSLRQSSETNNYPATAHADKDRALLIMDVVGRHATSLQCTNCLCSGPRWKGCYCDFSEQRSIRARKASWAPTSSISLGLCRTPYGHLLTDQLSVYVPLAFMLAEQLYVHLQ